MLSGSRPLCGLQGRNTADPAVATNHDGVSDKKPLRRCREEDAIRADADEHEFLCRYSYGIQLLPEYVSAQTADGVIQDDLGHYLQILFFRDCGRPGLESRAGIIAADGCETPDRYTNAHGVNVACFGNLRVCRSKNQEQRQDNEKYFHGRRAVPGVPPIDSSRSFWARLPLSLTGIVGGSAAGRDTCFGQQPFLPGDQLQARVQAGDGEVYNALRLCERENLTAGGLSASRAIASRI